MSDLQFGDFTVDPQRRQLRRGSEVVALPGKALDLLLYMAANAGRPLSKAEIMEAVWPGAFVEESNLTQNVFLLRKALGADGPILTLPGRGYQFTASVVSPAPPSDGHLVDGPITSLEATHSRIVFEEEVEERIDLRRSPLAIGLLATVVVLAGVAGWLGWQSYQDRVGGPPVQVVFADLDGGTGDPVLDRTLADAIRIDLTQSPFVSLVSANTVRRTLTEMMHKADERLTVALARDLCERTGSQAVLHGSVARVGAHYLLTEEATSCVDGATLASEKREAPNAEALPAAVDKLTATLRHGLGESRRTIARYSAPLLPVKTGSIEALEAFSQGSDLAQRGKLPEAIALQKRAIELDPNFAAAYAALATYYGNSTDRASSRTYIQKAYDLRQYANEPVQLQITTLYANNVTQDLYLALANYQAWTNLYPRNPVPWSGLGDVYRQLGRHAESIAAQQKALSLNNRYVVLYYGIALEQTHNGDTKAARATCDLALSKGMDSELIHGVLLQIARLDHDDTLFAQQVAWADMHPNATYVLSHEVFAAMSDGRMEDARDLITRLKQASEQQGLASAGITMARDFAEDWYDIGQVDDAQAALREGQLDPQELNQLVALAETGDVAKASTALQDQLASHPTATLWNKFYAPLVRAHIAYTEHRPKDALALLETTREFSGLTHDMDYLRGLAYLDLNDATQAESAFRAVLTHPFTDPLDPQIPLSWLGLGRALARENKTAEALDAYSHFVTLWSHSNGNPPLLQQARAESARLHS